MIHSLFIYTLRFHIRSFKKMVFREEFAHLNNILIKFFSVQRLTVRHFMGESGLKLGVLD